MRLMMALGPVIFVDDEPHVRAAARQTLDLAGYEVVPCDSAATALEHLSAGWPGILVTDVRMPGMDGLALMKHAQTLDPDLPVVLVTGHGDIAMAVQAIRAGAYDFLEKPFRTELLLDTVKRALEKRALTLENRRLRAELSTQREGDDLLVGKSPAIQQLRDIIANLADIDADVLIEGETGTGKDVVARCLHQQSHRRDRPFMALNCGALPENLIESELFGHEAGAFTGATGRRIGKFEHAQWGTVFLDEIESMPLALQVKLLRVLQERTVERLGSNKAIPLDIRVIAATKIDLQEASRQGKFREDLYYRLNVVKIELPPLRERREDIPLLFQHFVLNACARYRRPPPQLTSELLAELLATPWPGNVRELQHAADRFVLGYLGSSKVPSLRPREPGRLLPLPDQVAAFEKSVIVQELAHQKGSIAATCEALSVPRKTLYDKLRKYGLSREDFV